MNGVNRLQGGKELCRVVVVLHGGNEGELSIIVFVLVVLVSRHICKMYNGIFEGVGKLSIFVVGIVIVQRRLELKQKFVTSERTKSTLRQMVGRPAPFLVTDDTSTLLSLLF